MSGRFIQVPLFSFFCNVNLSEDCEREVKLKWGGKFKWEEWFTVCIFKCSGVQIQDLRFPRHGPPLAARDFNLNFGFYLNFNFILSWIWTNKYKLYFFLWTLALDSKLTFVKMTSDLFSILFGKLVEKQREYIYFEFSRISRMLDAGTRTISIMLLSLMLLLSDIKSDLLCMPGAFP